MAARAPWLARGVGRKPVGLRQRAAAPSSSRRHDWSPMSGVVRQLSPAALRMAQASVQAASKLWLTGSAA